MEPPPFFPLLLAALPLGLRPADLIDILLAAGFIYGLIRWLRQSTSPRLANRIIVAVLLLAATYATARHFEMAMLEMLVVVSLLLVGLGAAVFFQGDIQRTLDRLLLWRWRQPAPDHTPPLSPVGTLCEAVGALVSKRQGALIALRGSEPWSRQIDGGVRLEGLVSVPLLLSIFDPTSPGHDGAVLVEGGVVTRFGAHLPLSVAGPPTGTRHAAGLGLAERGDALVVIVSEERGTISVAQRGTLVEVPSAGALERLLTPFWEDHYGALVPVLSRWERLRRVVAPLFSLGLAALLWLLFVYSPGDAIQTFTVPIEYVNTPSEWELVEPRPASVSVTLSSSGRASQPFDPSTMLVSVDLSEIGAGTNRLAITESNVEVPRGWELYRVEPAEVVVRTRPSDGRRPPD